MSLPLVLTEETSGDSGEGKRGDPDKIVAAAIDTCPHPRAAVFPASPVRREVFVRAVVKARGSLSQPIVAFSGSLPEWFRTGPGRRLGPSVLALLAEAVLLLAVLTLGWQSERREAREAHLVSFDARPEGEKQPAHTKETPRALQKAQPAAVRPPVQNPAPTSPAARPVQLIQLSRAQLASADISLKPSSHAAKPLMGPVDTEASSDTKRVGTGPNGQPLYAAAWYREPYDDELSGYLSTATGPGWGMIACRTAPEYRVEDCVGIDEYPEGSHIMRAVLAAAWQFRVRPPRIGGRSMVGDWVRIRIDYDLK